MLKRVFSIFLSLFVINCNPITEKNTSESLEDFDVFYNKFHSDSVFQLSRIKFPLKGKKIDGFKKEEWTAKNWDPLITKITAIDTTEFKTSAIKRDSTFIQKCYISDSGFYTEYQFELVDGKWNLVYALDKNL
ncbi:hypothetical protein [Flavobacterium macacae]|uniref:Uncharacterized protein n=1 Tax=Flavobacterium macacae TaxID=2488993 RepID=A0A3P3W3U5_9FLAO|nr:hypothetical protein [Flavobacterium macacae]RRJ89761.1 hypothetical protein EG849_12185 [Flavobacterium macacae]